MKSGCLKSHRPRHPELVSGSKTHLCQTPIPNARDGVTVSAGILTF